MADTPEKGPEVDSSGRRRLLAVIAGLPAAAALGVGRISAGRDVLPTILPGSGKKLDASERQAIVEMLSPGQSAGRPMLQGFPGCPPFSQFSDGTDCPDLFQCSTFGCDGGLDDFECSGPQNFDCGTTFACTSSFDISDCIDGGGIFRCNSEYGCEGFSCSGGQGFACSSNFTGCVDFDCTAFQSLRHDMPGKVSTPLTERFGVKVLAF